MVYFKCIECKVTWTKLIDDGCPTCASPCQVEGVPPVKWIRDGEAAGPFARPPGAEKSFTTDIGVLMPMSAFLSDSEDSDLGTRYKGDDSRIPEQDRVDLEDDIASVQKLEKTVGPVTGADEDSNGDSPAIYQLGKPNSYSQLLYASSVNELPQRSSSSDLGNKDIELKQKANISPIHDIESTLSKLKVTTNDKSVSAIKDQSSNSVQGSEKKKKKARKSSNQKQNNPSAAAKKVMPQLELPDPIPSPEVNNKGGGWNNVVGRGIEKATKKMQNDTLKRINEREFINASSYLTRDIENEMPIRERGAIDVRFGLGGAKHDVRRVVPRSAVE